ncbi:amidohydrolase family protein [Chitinimonas sp.]|uniref:amidohydrolase family protein n=1 Tax=Chitinimonas sp. TaxID=1934313 RepID=UPI0035B4D66D
MLNGRALSAIIIGLLLSSAAAFAANNYEVRIQGQAAGKQTISHGADGETMVEFGYMDRGRGDHIVARWRLDERGIPTRYESSGNDYWKVPITEHFSVRDGKASWKNRAEQGELVLQKPAFYLPANPPPEITAVLARALLKAPDHRLALLPEGEASLTEAGSTDIQLGGKTHTLRQYLIRGLDFMPVPVWLDSDGNTAGVLADWMATLPADLQPHAKTLFAAQEQAGLAWSVQLAKEQTHQPVGPLLIRHATLFDPRDLSVSKDMAVLVIGERIVRIAEDAKLTAPPGAEVIDAAGRFLMPGMWDNHQHFGAVDGVFDLIAGVTSARDLANDNEAMLRRAGRFDRGEELGPRVSLAGIIEGVGPLAGPTDVRVDTAEKAIAAVDWYADHGYAQIKIYSSFRPQLVPIIAERAHARGMRVSGHVPAFTWARRFVEDGADEIQHLNFILLNFLYPEYQDTRDKDRYTRVAEQAHNFGPNDPRLTEFISFLRRHHTVLDPTLSVLEELYSGDASKAPPALLPHIQRFPAQLRRSIKAGAVVAPAGHEAAYRSAVPSLMAVLKALHQGGVTLLPGTDGFAGYGLHHELELYVQAGIAPAEVLRMATLVPAQVMGVDKDRGAIAAGKLADMVLIDGNPLERISDIRKVYRTIKGGKVYQPADIERALGMSPAI